MMTQQTKQIKEVIKETEIALRNLEKVKKDKPLKSDAIKTVKAIGYEKIIAIMKK